jgi:acyl-CoA reductase-like NAD-dependent aldehyde dehydrogenase
VSLLVAGEWTEGRELLDVRSPYSGDVVGTVSLAGLGDVDRALAAATEGARTMAATPAWQRAEILERAAERIARGEAELAATITAEQGKTTHEARAEAGRIAGIVKLCAAEARSIRGDVLPMDATREGEQRLGFTLREPCGVVVAISPFNYPAILVAHKIVPALAAGNAVILKPASATPLTALFIVRRLLEAGLPPLALQCVIGPGHSVGNALCVDARVRKVSFTGSRHVGEQIARTAGLKRFTCELGSNTAVVVLDDADVELAARALGRSPFVNAGQNCVSPQRAIVSRMIFEQLVEGVAARMDELRVGDPADPATTLAPVIDAGEADRVTTWIREARDAGATVVRGGDRDGTLVAPALILDPPSESKVWREELFGPGVTIRAVDGDDEALEYANDSRFGLSFGVYTRDLDRALRFARGARTGIAHVNSPYGTTWRADVMPWGGVGESGYGKEGVRYAVNEMTEEKVVVVHPAGAP